MQLPLKNTVYKLIFGQMSMVAFLAIILFLWQGVQSGFSAIVGGLAYVLPNFVLVSKVFGFSSARNAKKFVVLFFLGEALKLMISAILFVLAVQYLSMNVLSMLLGYALAIISFWVISFCWMTRQQGSL